MQIDPRYDGPAIVTVGGRELAAAFVRQRQRLAATLESLSDDEWAAPSRCADWTVQDVATHLVTVNGFWRYSIASGLAGKPTRLLVDFDPRPRPLPWWSRQGRWRRRRPWPNWSRAARRCASSSPAWTTPDGRPWPRPRPG